MKLATFDFVFYLTTLFIWSIIFVTNPTKFCTQGIIFWLKK